MHSPITSYVQALENALKTLYLEPITKMINEESGPVYAAIEKTSENIVGNEIVFAMQYGRHGGVGAIAETGDLPDPSPRSYAQGKAYLKNLAARINFTEKLMLTSQNNQAAFIDAVSTQMEDVVNDAKDMVRRNLIGSYTGVMAKVNTVSGKDVTIEGNIKPFYVGQVIDIRTGASAPKTNGVRIADVDYVAGKITLTENATGAAGDDITLHGNYGNELTGLTDILTPDTTIYGVDRSQNKWYNPHVYDKGASLVDFDSLFLQTAIDDIDDFAGRKPNFITCNAGIQRAYIQEQNEYKRNTEYKDVDGGYRLMAYNDVAISKEKYMPSNTIYLLDTEAFTLAQIRDWHWMDEDGNILQRMANKAAYEASLTKYCELLCKMPAAQAVIKGIKEA